MGRGQPSNQNGDVVATSRTSRPAQATATGDHLDAIDAAVRGDIHAVSDVIRRSGAHDDDVLAVRRDVLGVLTDAVLTDYEPRWSARFLPMLSTLNYPASAHAQSMLGPAFEEWEGGYWGCARTIAATSLDRAVEADRVRLAGGKRDRSGLTASWIAENISCSWSGTYLSQIGRHIEGQLPEALEQYAGERHAGWLAKLTDQAGGPQQLTQAFQRSMLNAMWRSYFKNKKPDPQADVAQVLLTLLSQALDGRHETRR